MSDGVWRRRLARLAAPAAFLAAVTIAALLVRGALDLSEPDEGTRTTATRPPATGSGTRTRTTRKPRPPARRYHVVRAGETLGTIAADTGTTVERLLRLNPGVDPVSLRVGQRVRVR